MKNFILLLVMISSLKAFSKENLVNIKHFVCIDNSNGSAVILKLYNTAADPVALYDASEIKLSYLSSYDKKFNFSFYYEDLNLTKNKLIAKTIEAWPQSTLIIESMLENSPSIHFTLKVNNYSEVYRGSCLVF